MTAEPDRRWLALILPAALALLGWGWWTLWFVCDDAYIAFRYISNRHLGYGYTWNPPPFAPVEGYTSFSWVVLLDLIWSWTGIEPPASAPVVGLACAVGTVSLTAWLAWRAPLPPALAGWRPVGVALALLGVVSNRTFLTWTSSGLETPLVVLLQVAWLAVVAGPRGPRWLTAVAAVAAALALTRPDGLLYVAALPALAWAAARGGRPVTRADLGALAPLASLVAHAVWRRFTYGDWLPNTWYAKVSDPWIAGGGNHFWLYVVENGWFFWVPLLALATRGVDVRAWTRSPVAVAAAVFVAHALYYILRVGGDHFEFRIYAHVPVLVFVGTVILVGRVMPRPVGATALLLQLVIATWVLPWPDWLQTRHVTDAEGIKKLHRPLADKVPAVVWPWARAHDVLEAYCVKHLLGTPWQTHAWFRVRTEEELASREVSMRAIGPDSWAPDATGRKAFPVTAQTSVGVVGWHHPYVAIIDRMGLNDRVIARNYPASPRFRYAAHDRWPPAGYVDCFAPNVTVVGGQRVHKREREVDAATIAACEADFLARVITHPASMDPRPVPTRDDGPDLLLTPETDDE